MPYRDLSHSELLVECLSARCSTEELLKCLHLILRTALLQHSVSVATAFLTVHRVLLEHGVEHVGRVDLTGQVAVVSGVVATDQMAKGRLAVTPVIALAEFLRPVKLADILAKLIVGLGRIESLDCIMRRAFMHCHIEDASAIVLG